MGNKETLLKPFAIECVDRLRKFIELDAPAVIIGAAAWHAYTTILATYGKLAAGPMVDKILEQSLRSRAVCVHEDCVGYAERPSCGLCPQCTAVLDAVYGAEEVQ